MQSSGARVALIVGALAVAVVAFLVLRPPDDGGGAAGTSASDEATTDRGGASGTESGVTEIDVRNGQPVGGIADVQVQSGEEVNLLVRADVEEEVHVHGYDEMADVAPGAPARVRFPADIQGVFEVELEGSATQIARLEITP